MSRHRHPIRCDASFRPLMSAWAVSYRRRTWTGQHRAQDSVAAELAGIVAALRVAVRLSAPPRTVILCDCAGAVGLVQPGASPHPRDDLADMQRQASYLLRRLGGGVSVAWRPRKEMRRVDALAFQERQRGEQRERDWDQWFGAPRPRAHREGV